MARRLMFEVPIPAASLSPNSRVTALHRAGDVAAFREAVRVAALAAMRAARVREDASAWDESRGPAERIAISLTFGTAKTRELGITVPRDRDNQIGMFKAGQDGLVDAGIVRDDSARHVESTDVFTDASWGPGIRVTVVERSEPPAAAAPDDVDEFGLSGEEREVVAAGGELRRAEQVWEEEDGEERPVEPPAPMAHAFEARDDGRDACALCDWARADHAGGSDSGAASEGEESEPDADPQDGANTIGALSTALGSIQSGANDGPKRGQGDMPLGVRPELHHDRPISQHLLKFVGKASLWLSNPLHRDLWDDLRIGHVGTLHVAYEVAGDGHAPVRDKDGDVVGLAEFRRIKVGAVDLGAPTDQTEGLPLFESERLQLRRELRLFAERIEHLARNEPATAVGDLSSLLADLDAECESVEAQVRAGRPPQEVTEAAAALAFVAWRLAEWVAAGGDDVGAQGAGAPTVATEPYALCACGDFAEEHVGDVLQECGAVHGITMGDGATVEQRCSCTGFRGAAITEPEPRESAETALESALVASLAIARGRGEGGLKSLDPA